MTSKAISYRSIGNPTKLEDVHTFPMLFRTKLFPNPKKLKDSSDFLSYFAHKSVKPAEVIGDPLCCTVLFQIWRSYLKDSRDFQIYFVFVFIRRNLKTPYTSKAILYKNMLNLTK